MFGLASLSMARPRSGPDSLEPLVGRIRETCFSTLISPLMVSTEMMAPPSCELTLSLAGSSGTLTTE